MNAKESLKKFEAAILEDGRVDRAEAQVLLAFARPLADADPEMAGFVELLEKVLLLHGRIMEQYEKAIPDPNHRLRKIQTFWDYLEPVTGRRSQKALQKAGNMKNYLKALEDLGVFHIFTRNTQPTSIVSR